MNLFESYNEELVPDCPVYCDVEHKHEGEYEFRYALQDSTANAERYNVVQLTAEDTD